MAVSKTKLTSQTSSSNSTTYTFTGVACNALDTHAVVGITHSGSARDISSVTITGNVSGAQTATIITQAGAQTPHAGIVAAPLAGDTSFDVAVTFSGGTSRASIHPWATRGMTLTGATGSGQSGSGPTVAATVTVPADGAGFAVVMYENGSNPTWTWTNFTEDDELTIEGNRTGSSASILGANSTETTATASTGSNGIIMSIAAFGPSSTAYSVVADAGSYVYTGVAAALLAGWKLIADRGTYAYTGVAAGLLAARKMAADVGTYTLAGIAADLRKGQILIADAGSYVYTGVAATLQAVVSMLAAAGSYAYTGVAANLKGALKVLADVGTYTYTGVDAALRKGQILIAAAGSYTLTGIAALKHIVIRSAAGAYALTGVDALLDAGKRIRADAGVYALSGLNAVMVYRLPLAASVYWVKRKAQATLALVRQVAPSLSKARRVQSRLRQHRQSDPTLGD